MKKYTGQRGRSAGKSVDTKHVEKKHADTQGKKYMSELVEAFLKMKNNDQMLNFLQGILSDREITDVVNRLQIIKLLKNGTRQRDIANTLNVGIATVTRGSRELRLGKFAQI